MNSILKNYGSTFILLSALIIGGLVGVYLPGVAAAVKPVGQLFLNFLFVLVVPMVFFAVTLSIHNMKKTGMIGRVFVTIVAVFISMSVIAGVVTYIGTLLYDPVGEMDRSIMGELMELNGSNTSLADAVVGSVSVSDFLLLFSKANLLPLIVFSALLGYVLSSVGEKAKPVIDILEGGNAIIMKMMDIVMKVAPLGLGCFFADTVSTLGGQIFKGYLRSFILYLALTLLFFFVINSLYVFIAKGWNGVKAYWRYILPPSLTAMATCSSAVAMPGNIEAAKKMGITPDIAESVIPFGTNVHKDGSVMSGVVKTAFLMILYGQSISTLPGAGTVLVIGILSSIVLGAVTGGGMVGELLICTMLGVPAEMAGIIIVIGTILDMPATMLNASSNVVGAILVDRFCPRRQK